MEPIGALSAVAQSNSRDIVGFCAVTGGVATTGTLRRQRVPILHRTLPDSAKGRVPDPSSTPIPAQREIGSHFGTPQCQIRRSSDY